MAKELDHHGQSIGDQSPDSNVHVHICHNVVVPHFVETISCVSHVVT